MANEELRADEKTGKGPHELFMFTGEQCRHAMHSPQATKTSLSSPQGITRSDAPYIQIESWKSSKISVVS
jgi:hypothetical protein